MWLPSPSHCSWAHLLNFPLSCHPLCAWVFIVSHSQLITDARPGIKQVFRTNEWSIILAFSRLCCVTWGNDSNPPSWLPISRNEIMIFVTVPKGYLSNKCQCSRHLCFWHQHPTSLLLVQMHYFLLKDYPLSAFGSCCFLKASSIFSIKVDTWYRPKPIRIPVCPIHMVGFDMSMWCPWRPETALKWQTDCILVKEGMII